MLISHLFSYSMFGRITNFKFASDVSAKNCRIQNKCNTEIVMNWKKELQSSCFSTPIIYPIHQEGKEDVLYKCVPLPRRLL